MQQISAIEPTMNRDEFLLKLRREVRFFLRW